MYWNGVHSGEMDLLGRYLMGMCLLERCLLGRYLLERCLLGMCRLSSRRSWLPSVQWSFVFIEVQNGSSGVLVGELEPTMLSFTVWIIFTSILEHGSEHSSSTLTTLLLNQLEVTIQVSTLSVSESISKLWGESVICIIPLLAKLTWN